MPPDFPFTQVIGQDKVKTALLLISIDPKIGGVLISGPRGTAKSTIVRSIAALKKNQPFVNVPLGSSEEMITGSFDLEKALGHSEVAFKPGLLARADQGILYVDEVNLLSDNLVDLLLDVSASGINTIERDGISHSHKSVFSLVGTMNPDEGELRPQLLDRFGLFAPVQTDFTLQQRKQIVQQRLVFDAQPEKMTDSSQQATENLIAEISWAQQNLGNVSVSEKIQDSIAQRCKDANVEGFRGDITLHRAACAYAALQQRKEVLIEDLDIVEPLVLDHRRKNSTPPAQSKNNPSGGTPQTNPDQNSNNSDPGSSSGSSIQGSWGIASPTCVETGADLHFDLESNPESRPNIKLDRIKTDETPKNNSLGTNRKKGAGLSNQYYLNPEMEKRKISWYQTLASTPGFSKMAHRQKLRTLKFKSPKRQIVEMDLVLLDTSASTLSGQGLSHAKAILKRLSLQSYLKRRQLGIITFGNDQVITLLHPQRAPKNIDNLLNTITAGGGTPARNAFDRAANLLKRHQFTHIHCSVFLITDGRLQSMDDKHPFLTDNDVTVVDIESGRIKLGLAQKLANNISARYLHISNTSAAPSYHPKRIMTIYILSRQSIKAINKGNHMSDTISQSTSENTSDNKHQQRMARKKSVVDERIAKATEERGVLILLKGNGKGKSSSAFGTMARALGHGQKAGLIQFIKGRKETGEYLFFKDHPQVDFHVMGHGFTWETQDKSQDIEAARQAWKIAEGMLSDAQYNILVFDEMSYMFKYEYLDVEPVAAALKARPKNQNVIITGRTMHRSLLEIADTISDIADTEHAFRKGVKAQPGIEW